MSQNYCHHVNAAGVFCRGIPVKKRDYCYWHLHESGRRMKAARARAQAERVVLQLPVLDDLHAVQVGLMQLGEAIAHGEIDDRRGRLLLAVLRLAASNLKAQRIWEQEMETQDDDRAQYVVEDSGFEEQYGLREGFDLSVDPEVVFPLNPKDGLNGAPEMRGNDNLPLHPNEGLSGTPEMYGNENDLRVRFGQMLRDAATPIPGCDFRVTADDMELTEVYEREGQQAGLERAAVLERNRKRRERREQRMRYEEMARNRNIQLAAEKMLLDQQRKAAGSADGHAEVSVERKPPQPEGKVIQSIEASVAVM